MAIVLFFVVAVAIVVAATIVSVVVAVGKNRTSVVDSSKLFSIQTAWRIKKVTWRITFLQTIFSAWTYFFLTIQLVMRMLKGGKLYWIRNFSMLGSGLQGFTFIDNNNINDFCLNRGKLHLNRRGSPSLANNFKKFVESLWESKSSAKVYWKSHKHLKIELNDLRSLRIRNPCNIIFSYLNLNSIRYKFDKPKTIINKNLDILCIAESKK